MRGWMIDRQRERGRGARDGGKKKENGTVTREGCERDPSFSLARGWGRPFSRVLNIFMMAAGAGGAAWKWRVGGGCEGRGRGSGGWMEEGGQAERSTRGGPRGEKLEKGRFKYQPPRGGPRARYLYLAIAFLLAPPPLRLALSHSRGAPAPPRATTLFTTLRRSSLMHTHTQVDVHSESPRTERYVHRRRRSRTHIYRSSAREKAS